MSDAPKPGDFTRWEDWWNSLTPEQKKERRERMKRVHDYWMAERKKVLFGLLEYHPEHTDE